ncbi:MAG: ABC transporter permease [Verrucomicrobiota bacterium]
MQDLKFAFRQLVKNPGFTAVAVLTLALGIGANTTVFSWIQSVLLNPLTGVAESNRLLVIAPRHASGTVSDTASYLDAKDFGEHSEIFSGVIASQMMPISLTVDKEPEWIWGQIVTANFFDVLGVRAAKGRTFLPEEETKPGGHPVVVISDGLWRRRFASDTNILGKTVVLNRHTFTIVGIAPSDFQGTMGGLAFDLWAPLMMYEQLMPGVDLRYRRARSLHTIGRLRSGLPLAQAQVAVTTLGKQWEEAYPEPNKNIGFTLFPLWKSPWGAQSVMLPLLSVLFAVTVLVLLIVIANVANLLLARATSREREMAVRLALGASRVRLVRQLLTESVLLALFGGALGIMFASWGIEIMRGLLPWTHLPLAFNIRLDARALGFTTLLALLAGIFFGLAPAWQSTRSNLFSTLKEGGRGASAQRHWLRSCLVATEIALALLLLIGAGLCYQSFQYARRMNMGFDPRNVVIAAIHLSVHGHGEKEGKIFYRRLLERLHDLPFVEAAGMANYVPLGPEGGPTTRVQVEGYVPQPNENMSIAFNIISPRYFATLRIPMVDGRDFTVRDDDTAPGAVVVNETVARRFWPGQSALGRRLKVWGDRTVTVVGVVKDGKYRRLGEPQQSFFYLPFDQFYEANMDVHGRTASNPLTMLDTVRREVRATDSAVQVWVATTLTDVISFAFFTQRIAASLLIVLGAVALLLAVIGIYGVMAFSVSQRTQEIGIRMALGAQRFDVIKLVFRHGFRLAAIGVIVGLVSAVAFTRLLSSLLLGVNAIDPVTFVGVPLTLMAVTLGACYLPARRATKVDPMVALRCE